jgi:hypothetical protein
MFFGLMNSPATFQRMMDTIFRKAIMTKRVKVYVDDILIHSETLQEHGPLVWLILQILRENGLSCKPMKCEFEQTRIEYLGSIIEQGKVEMNLKKISAIVDWKAPKKVKEIQAFLGTLNEYRWFIQGFSTIACPLHQLTRKDAIWRWMKTEQDAFDGLKRAITTAPVLRIADHRLPFKIETDASDFALGANLSQKHEDGLWHPVAYYS